MLSSFNVESIMSEKSKLNLAEIFARKKHLGQLRKDGITPFSEHLESVVDTLKQLGIKDEEVLCAGWLHDSIENTDTTYDDINHIFGKTTALLVQSLTKNKSLPNKQSELQYIKVLKNVSLNAKMIKLCDISSNLNAIHKSSLSNKTKAKKVKKINNYLNAIKNDIFENISCYSNVESILTRINKILSHYGLQPIKTNIR